MTSYLAIVSLIFSAIIFFSAKTEEKRVVTIQKPVVITQERRTPAYFVYQQAKAVQKKPEIQSFLNSKRLSNLNIQSTVPKIQVAEMIFTRREYAKTLPKFDQPIPQNMTSKIIEDLDSRAYDKVVYNSDREPSFVENELEVNEISPLKKWATIRGKLELRDGVGIVNHKIDIKRIEEGIVREQGRIDLNAGEYNIDIESPNGYLIAQIRDQTGLIIGEDRKRLTNLRNKGSYLEGPFIEVGRPDTLAANLSLPKPTKTAKSDSKSDVFGRTKQKPELATVVAASIFDNQKQLTNPHEEFTNISQYSSSIVRLNDPSQIYADTTTIRMTGDKTETPVLTKKWIDGAVSYVSDIQKIQFRSKDLPVLIGKVLVDGAPVAGAQVEIQTIPSAQPIYFDQFMIPTPTTNETGLNGYFMFLGLEEDVYEVAVRIKGRLVSSQIFIAESGRVAFQNIQSVSAPKGKVIRTFDAFLSEPMPADIVVADQEDVLQTTDGSLGLNSYIKSNVAEFIVRTNASVYAPFRYVQNGGREYAHIPLIQEGWLRDIMTYKKINEAPNSGIVIGFTEGLQYEAFVSVEEFSKNNIVYFNKYGQITEGPELGGGFILFNVPVGAREVILQDSASQRIYSQVFNIRNNQISVSHFVD